MIPEHHRAVLPHLVALVLVQALQPPPVGNVGAAVLRQVQRPDHVTEGLAHAAQREEGRQEGDVSAARRVQEAVDACEAEKPVQVELAAPRHARPALTIGVGRQQEHEEGPLQDHSQQRPGAKVRR